MCLKETESTTGHPVGIKSQLNVSGKEKTQAKAKKKLPAENISYQNGLDSDSGVSITDGSNNPSIANSACSRKKKFSKTAKLVGQVEKTVEEFEDSVVTEESGAKQQENSVTAKGAAMKKRQNLQREKLVNQVKLHSQEKPVNQVNDCEDKEEGGAIMKSTVVNGNGGKRNVAKSVRIASEEGRSEDDDADEEEETCTEEDEQRSRQENERRAERKQRTKFVKKVKVRLS